MHIVLIDIGSPLVDIGGPVVDIEIPPTCQMTHKPKQKVTWLVLTFRLA